MGMQKGERYGVRATVYERFLCRYNNGLNSRYACLHKGCKKKLRNGRCGIPMCRLEVDAQYKETGNCLDMELK